MDILPANFDGTRVLLRNRVEQLVAAGIELDDSSAAAMALEPVQQEVGQAIDTLDALSKLLRELIESGLDFTRNFSYARFMRGRLFFEDRTLWPPPTPSRASNETEMTELRRPSCSRSSWTPCVRAPADVDLAGRQGFGTIRDVREHVAILPERRADQPNERACEVSECGWEAGIRTPITWSRATCPTVGRPPSTSSGAPLTGNVKYSQSKTGPASRRGWN